MDLDVSPWEKRARWCLRADAALRASRCLPIAEQEPLAMAIADLASRGMPLSVALQATAALAGAAARTAQERSRLLAAWRWRISLCFVAGVSVRLLFMGGVQLTVQPYRTIDVIALTVAVILGFVADWWVRAALPSPWLTPVNLARWCGAYAGGDVPYGAPAAAQLLVLRWREVDRGVSCVVSRHAALQAWQERRYSSAVTRLARVADILPLAELGGGGVAAVLVMLAPLLASLGA